MLFLLGRLFGLYPFVLGLLLGIQPCFSQKILALDRSGHVKRVRFDVEDEVKLWLPDTIAEGQIDYIGETSITVNGKEIHIADITAIKYAKNGFGAALLKQAMVKFPIAGGALLLFDVVNGAVDPKYSRFTPGIVITAGALILSGPIAYFLVYRKYKIGQRNQLKILDLEVK